MSGVFRNNRVRRLRVDWQIKKPNALRIDVKPKFRISRARLNRGYFVRKAPFTRAA